MQNQQNQSRSLVAPGSASQFLQPVVSGEPGGVFTGPLYYFFGNLTTYLQLPQ